MARPITNKLPYVGLPTDWLWAEENEVLKAKFGKDGMYLWLDLYLGCFGANGYYKTVTDDHISVLAASHGISEDFVKDVLRFLASHDMIDGTILREHHIITSRDIQLTFQEAVRKRGSNRKVVVEKDIWLLLPEETLSFISFSASSNFCHRNPPETPVSPSQNPSFCTQKKKKEKEIKENKTKQNEMTEHPRVRFTPTPLAYGRRYRAARERKKMTGQSISQRCESLRRIYEETLGDLLPHQQSVNPDTHYPLIRQGMLRGYTTADYRKVFDSVKGSRFLQGENGRFRATFGWLINPEKMKKVLAGEYEDYAGVGCTAKASKKNPAVGEEESFSSFDTDEFFNAALRRSYEIHGYPSAG